MAAKTILQIFKDLISLFVYIFIAPFYYNKNAILLYHSIDNIEPKKDLYQMNVNPALFEKHARYLSKRKHDYLLTFDDGFENIYTNAFPVFKKYNLKSVIFITTDYIDSKINLNRFFNCAYPLQPLTWTQIKNLHFQGVEIGSHTLTHSDMCYIDAARAYEEAAASRKRIEEVVGCEVSSFAYPFGNRGSFNEDAKNILKKAGYKKVYTNIMGMDNSQNEPFMIRRIRIYGTDNIFRFKMKIAGAYNWVDNLNWL